MNEIVKMCNDYPVRILEQDGNPWFVAKDVCQYFGDTDHKRSVSRLDPDEIRKAEIQDSMGRKQTATIVNEPGLYHLLFNYQPEQARSKDGGARIAPRLLKRVEKIYAFKRWVTHEVIPSIRKNGAYVQPNSNNEGIVRAVLAAMNEQVKSVVVENLKMKTEIHYLKNFKPQGNVGDISSITGLPKVNWQRARFTSGRGRPYQKLIDSCRDAEQLSLFNPPLFSAPVS